MTFELKSKNIFEIIARHYEFISIFDKVDEYVYVGEILRFNKETNEHILRYSINKINNGYTESYRSSEFFTEEPRVL